MEDHIEKAKPWSRKRSRKPKSLVFEGWGSKNLMNFLESLGRDTTNKISEYDATDIVRKYIRELTHPLKTATKKRKKTKVVACDEKLSLLFGCQKVNTAKLSDLVAKHYVENQEDGDFNYLLYSSEEEEDKKQRLALLSDKVVEKPRGSIAAIVRDNVKLLYLRKSLVEELAKTCETFEGKVLGTFVRIKNPCHQLVQVTGVKEGNPIDGHFLQVTNYCDYLKDVASSSLSDDDFTQEECEELNQRMKNGSVKRLTVVDMEEKVRSLHEDVTKHWIARELVLLKRKINQASEKGWKRELSQYLDRRELLSNPEEKSRLLLEVPEVIAEELEPERVDDDDVKEDAEEREFVVVAPDSPEVVAEELEPDVKVEDDFMETNTEVSIETPKLRDEEDQPPWAASARDKDVLEDVEEKPLPEDSIITQKEEDSINVQPQAQAKPNPPEIIELSDDDEEEDNDNAAYLKECDPKKKMWCYELPKGQTNGPYSLEDFKRWSVQEYFVDVPDFKVFKIGNSIESGVLLTKILPHIKA
ncbi:uncharacterized protein At5g08430-like [Raphanus sativus]|uniref:Uncharacterized protein At5g08430-like n=1 Tax=Raphanus sativus TaxID=3726 RepID=A0A9W3BYZ4_RAPSA|nr:uncharacterized protein At5g08430-like [Raphanus sativus]